MYLYQTKEIEIFFFLNWQTENNLIESIIIWILIDIIFHCNAIRTKNTLGKINAF